LSSRVTIDRLGMPSQEERSQDGCVLLRNTIRKSPAATPDL